MKENLLVDLSKQFAVDIVNLCTDIKENRKSNVLINQVLRSGTSIGANVSETENAQSKADFISKMNIALKEANETQYWLRLLYSTDYLSDKEFESINADITELIAILTSICKTAKAVYS